MAAEPEENSMPPKTSPSDDEEGWTKRFAEKRDVIRRLAREAIDEDDRGETRPLSDLL